MGIIYWAPWNLTCLVCPVPSTYVEMPSPALGPAVLRWGNNVVSLPPQDLTQQSGLITHLAPDFCWGRQKYDCMVQCISSLRHWYTCAQRHSAKLEPNCSLTSKFWWRRCSCPLVRPVSHKWAHWWMCCPATHPDLEAAWIEEFLGEG